MHEFELTKRIKLGEHYGDLIVNEADDSNPEESKRKLNEWFESTGHGKKCETKCDHVNYNLARGFRLEIENSEVRDNEFVCDGETLKATKVHCSFVKTKNILQACIKREKH